MNHRRVTLTLAVVVIAGCAAEPAPPPTGAEVVREAVRIYGGGVPFHGDWVLRQSQDPGDVMFEVWFRPPAFRVEFVGEGLEHPGEWVSDDGLRVRAVDPETGEASIAQIGEFTDGVLPFALVDPFQYLLQRCRKPDPLGRETMLGRPVTRLSCEQGSTIVEHWIDDGTGLILRAEVRADDRVETGWVFTQIDFDPTFEPGTFDVGEV